MTSAFVLFLRLIVRPLGREPVRTLLTVFAVALGVAVVIAIDLAGDAAAGSFHSSLETLTGGTDLEISAIGGLDEKVLGRLVQLPYAFDFAARITDFASINGKGEALPFIGLDLIGHAGDHAPGQQNDTVPDPDQLANSVWVGQSLGLRSGQRVQLVINDTRHEFQVAGVLPPNGNRIGENNVIVADIGLAQRVTGKSGKLDSIDVRVPPGRSVEYWRAFLERQLPASISVDPRGAYTEENRKMMAAFRWNLRVLSYVALVVGAFLIYNTISISVVRRRNEIGVLRALGATRALIANGFLAESLFFAVVGSAIGVLLGRLLAIGAVRLVGSTVQALYVSSHPGAIALSSRSVITGVVLGCGVAVLAALAPAFEAAQTSPIEAMARGRHEYVAGRRGRRSIVFAIFLILAAIVLCRLPPIDRQPVFAYIAVLLLIAATALAIPSTVGWLDHVAHPVVARLAGVEALLALRSLRASVGRTSVLTAALATAVAMTASVGIMVGSFRETVWQWMNDELKADFYLRPAQFSGSDRHPTLNPGLAGAIERLPGVAGVDRYRAYAISYEGTPATLAAGETDRVRSSATTRFLPGENRDAILNKLPTGDYAVVSEPFANKHNVHPGSMLVLPLGDAVHSFKVLGIYYDYATERGFITLHRRILLKYLPDPAPSSLAVYLVPSANPRQVRQSIDRVINGRAIAVASNADLRRGGIAVFDRTFRITYALEAVAVIVAVMGIAGALLAMVIDRRREFALLRFLGGAPSQITGIILCEAGILGLLANVMGLLLGVALSLILIFVINKQSFGWTIQFHWPTLLVVTVLSVVYAATVVAGLYPARVTGRMNPIDVIHEE